MTIRHHAPQAFTPKDPDYDARVRASFARQRVMATLGITIEVLSPGRGMAASADPT